MFAGESISFADVSPYATRLLHARASSLICPMWSELLLLVSLIPPLVSSDCVDRSPYCNPNDCTVRPGYAREFCRKTCGNCTDFCENSKFVSCTDDRKTECDAMLRDYCPVLCGVCRAKKRPTTTTTTTTPSPLTTPLVLPPHIEINKPGPRKSPPKEVPVTSNRIDDTLSGESVPSSSPIQPIYTATVTPVFFPEPPHPEPIRPPYWAPQPTGYYPNTDIRRSPTRSLFPVEPEPLFAHHKSSYVHPTSADRNLKALVTLLGCRDRDPGTCSKITDETCLSRPGFYLKLCPVRCRNCDGLQCFDSIKVDCDAVRHAGGCRLAAAAEYCPRTCQMCAVPPSLVDSVSVCRDELETCPYLAEGGLCNGGDGELLRIYCARSCGFCKSPQYYMHSPFVKSKKAV